MKYEIYSIVFDKRKNDKGELLVNMYTIGEVSAYRLKKPKHIGLKDDKIIVTFEDDSRHIMVASGVEIFDRVIKPKEDANKSDKINKKTV
jgi:hypothetical protein